MEAALELAREAAVRGEVPVGAVVVLGGRILGQGANRTETRQDPTAHAELLALRDAAGRLGSWRLTGTTLYTTLEPCAMCAGACVLARIDRLVYGTDDPKGGMCGSLENLVEDPRLNHRIEVVRGVAAREAGELLKEFFRGRRGSSPAPAAWHEEPVGEQTRHDDRHGVDPAPGPQQEGQEPEDQEHDKGGPEHSALT